MKRKILIALLSFVLLFVGFIPVMNASTNVAVPNTGYIENIYFNTTLTNSEVDALLSNLEYTDISGNLTYGIFSQGDYDASIHDVDKTIQVAKIDNNYMIGVITESEPIFLYESSTGFNTEEEVYIASLNCEAEPLFVNEYLGISMPVGLQNNELVELVYIVSDTPTPTYTPLVFNIFETIGNIATGFGGLVVSLFTSAFNLIYNNGTLTTLGIIILISLATGLLIWAFVFIRRLIKIRSK